MSGTRGGTRRRRTRLPVRLTATLVTAVALLAAPAVAAADIPATGPPQPITLIASPTGQGTACTPAAPCSLTTAQQRARALDSDMHSNIVVTLEDGTYDVSQHTLAFGPRDSGTNGHTVIYAAAPGPIRSSAAAGP